MKIRSSLKKLKKRFSGVKPVRRGKRIYLVKSKTGTIDFDNRHKVKQGH